jgi:soluble lytic murein transglycosylase-like protein
LQHEELLSSSKDLYEDREAALGQSCLSVFLFPPFSVLFFGTLLFWGLTSIPVQPAHAAEPTTQIASFFAASVQRWEPQIIEWAAEHDLDPNLVATVMQIESCGDPQAVSRAGAMGLFQVMPYHFTESENSLVPDTNAQRGLSYLKNSLEHFDDNASLALAGYNGGINGASRPASQWAQETIDYRYWGENIYADAIAGKTTSPVLQEWLEAGGASLCAQAEQRLAVVP